MVKQKNYEQKGSTINLDDVQRLRKALKLNANDFDAVMINWKCAFKRDGDLWVSQPKDFYHWTKVMMKIEAHDVYENGRARRDFPEEKAAHHAKLKKLSEDVKNFTIGKNI